MPQNAPPSTELPFLLLFDLDGTLMLSNGAGMRSMDKVAKQLFGSDFQWEGITPGGNLDPLIFSEAAKINKLDNPQESHHRFKDAYLKQLALELDAYRHEVQIMPGFPHLLHQLKEREQTRGDVVVGLLTGNYTEAVPIKLKAIGLTVDLFSLTVFGDEVADRPSMVRLAMKRYATRYGQPPVGQKVIVIGDTPRDVHCAAVNGCTSLAVATGPCSYETLAQASPTAVLKDLSDPQPLFSLLDEMTDCPSNGEPMS